MHSGFSSEPLNIPRDPAQCSAVSPPCPDLPLVPVLVPTPQPTARLAKKEKNTAVRKPTHPHNGSARGAGPGLPARFVICDDGDPKPKTQSGTKTGPRVSHRLGMRFPFRKQLGTRKKRFRSWCRVVEVSGFLGRRFVWG